jgi:signal transduction histidine kinase
MTVELHPGPPFRIHADPNQLDQLLINLLRNAVDAAQPVAGKVAVGWNRNGDHLDVWVEDEGPGLANSANLFVPFFTTKPGGSGIGLALCRQIAEMHNGSLSIENRKDRSGCRATLRIPIG